MRLALVLIGLAPFAIGACAVHPAGPAMDCSYNAGGATTRGSSVANYMLCTPSPVIQSEQAVAE
ncbi:MAG TPA: hypothetical protein VLT79_11595 [Gemmatimonadales bacterium]|nr:hypothetical protein [Gemmatimonadales bacterium]